MPKPNFTQISPTVLVESYGQTDMVNPKNVYFTHSE